MVIGALCQDCTGSVLDLKRVRPGPPGRDISRPGVTFTGNGFAVLLQPLYRDLGTIFRKKARATCRALNDCGPWTD